jgi:hypothetical protein
MLAEKGVTDLPRERVRDLAASVLSSLRNHTDKAVAMAGEGSLPHNRSSIESGNQRASAAGLPQKPDTLADDPRGRFVPISDIDHGWRLSQRGS